MQEPARLILWCPITSRCSAQSEAFRGFGSDIVNSPALQPLLQKVRIGRPTGRQDKRNESAG
jgi:hypothetical protein